MELKYVSIASDDAEVSLEIGLRKEQYLWLRKAKRAGRRVCLLARVGKFWYIWDTEEAWDLAKRPSQWAVVKRMAAGRFANPTDALLGFASCALREV